MSTSSHFIRAAKSDEITTEVDREYGTPRLSIQVGDCGHILYIHLTEDQLASIAGVLSDDQDALKQAEETP